MELYFTVSLYIKVHIVGVIGASQIALLNSPFKEQRTHQGQDQRSLTCLQMAV